MKQKQNLWIDLICSFVIGWLGCYLILGNPMASAGLDTTKTQNFIVSVTVLLVIAGLAFLLGRKNTCWFHIITVGVVFSAEVLSLIKQNSDKEILGFSLVLGVVIYIFREDLSAVTDNWIISDLYVKRIFIGLAVLLFAFLAVVGCCRYILYFSLGHDLGIFTQMYEYMLDTGLQLTTLERNRLMSHFEIHISPIYYLLLPIYALFPGALTLQTCQAVLVAISLIPLYLICRHYQLSNNMTVVIGILYSCYPALSGSCFNDFHENAFIPLLLLSVIYAVEKNKNVLFFISMILALLVKEDVAIQIAVLAVFFIISGRNVKKGCIMLISAGCYLIFALWILSHGYEAGVLDYMSNMYLTESGGMPEVIQTVIMNPGYALRQCFTSERKLLYLGWIFFPVIPALIVKKHYFRYILLIYMIFMNLVPGSGPLTLLRSQYHFPVTVFIFYLIIMNVSEWDAEQKRDKIPVMIGMTVFLFTTALVQPAMYYGVELVQNRDMIQRMDKALELIPDDASVSASGEIVPHLADHKEVYGLYVEEKTDYIVVDYRPKTNADLERINNWINTDIYEEIYCDEDVIKVYCKK